MSDRQNWSRLVASIFALTLVSAFAFAAIAPRSFTSFFTAEATQVEPSAEPVAQTPVLLGGPVCTTVGPIELQSSGGTTTATAYPTLNDAFLAIIAGTHTGFIDIRVCANTTETASATLTASGIGATSYTSVTIRPVGGARVIEGSIVGAIIRLNGADNVTIDGRQGGVGTARDLTVRNTNTAAATAAIWLSSVAAGNGAANNTIRNLEIAAGIDESSSSASATFGIAMCGTTISVTANGVDNDNNSFISNRIIRARYGIMTRGTTTDLNINPVITGNIVGPNAFGSDQIGKVGIFLQADTGATVSGNTVQFVGCLDPQACTGADRMGIAIGNESWSMTPGTITSNTYTVTKNVVHDVIEETTFSSIGINLATTGGGVATNNLVANNFIYNVRANGTAGDQAVGLGIAGGHTDRVVFNSIAMTGDVDPGASAASSNFGSGIRVANVNGTTHLNLTLMNNSVYMDLSSSSGPTVRFYAISGNSAAYLFGTGGENFNNYYINPSNTQLQTGGLGTTSGVALTTQFATLANWQAAYTAPQDANSIQANPLHFSNTSDPHISGLSPNIDAGTAIAGIAEDIDGQVRPNGAGVDIGGDEFYPAPGTVQLNSATYSATEVSGMVTITVTRAGGATGAVTVDYATSNGTATGGGSCGAGIDYVSNSGTLMWGDNDFTPKAVNITICNDADVESSETVNITLSNPTGGATIGTPSSAVLTILNSVAFSGTVSVGAGETYTSLTNPGGLFEAINNGSLTANTTANITSDSTGETGAIALNQFTGAFTLTIQPSGGAARIISGGSATVLLDFNGADGVTIDGLNTGGNALTIRNTTAGAGTAVRYINDASNNNLLSSTLEGGGTSSVLSIGNGTTTGNDNISVVGNVIRDRTDATSVPFNVINLFNSTVGVTNGNILIHNNQIINFAQAGIVVNLADNVTFTNNNIFQTASRTTALLGVAVNSSAGTNLFSGNQVHDLTTTVATTGLSFNDARDTTVSRNRVYNFPSTSGSTGTLTGIIFNGSSGNPAAVTVVNNMVSIIPSFTNAQIVRGIYDFAFAGNTFNSYFNSVLVSGTGSGASSTWACVRGTSAPTAYTMTDNICFNNRTGGTGNHFAMGDQSNGTGTLASNFNIFVGTGATAANFFDRGTVVAGTPVDFAGWQAGGRDANSQAANPGGNYTVANMFVSPTDLHLANEGMNPASNTGTPVMGVTTDFDGDTRSATTPEIGFDEFAGPAQADLGVTKTDSPDPVLPGGNITYTINFINNGPDTAVSTTITDVVPANTSFVSASQTSGPTWTITSPPPGGTGSVVFAKGSVASAETAVFSIVVNVNLVTAGGTVISNTATAVSATPDPTPANNSATATTTVASPGTLQLSSTTYSGSEGGNATVTVDRVSGSSGIVGATYTLTDLSGAVGGAACTAGVDYINTGGTVTFGNGVISQPIVIPLCPDAVTDPAETFTVTISAPTGGAVLGSPVSATVTITDVAAGGPVTVTATAGTMGPTPYNTVKEAFDAINAGTHQGAITVLINANTTETASAVLNASGGTASYTSVLVRPSAPVTVSGSIVGAIIRLNGADNVTIDGRIGGTGTGRDLSVINNQSSAATAAIWLSSTGVGAGATNNVIRNLELACGANTSTSTLATFGIFMGGATIAVATNGEDNDNNSFLANRIIRSRYGIATRGNPANLNLNTVVADNIIGPSAFGADQIGKVGIFLQADDGAVVSRNTVQFVGGAFANTTVGADRVGIGLGSETWGSTPTTLAGANYTVTRNVVHDVIEERTFSAVGIFASATNGVNPTNNLIANNFVYNVNANGTVGDTAIGIGVGAGNGDRVVFNSVRMAGDSDPNPSATTPTQNPMNLRVANTPTNLTIKNNSLYLDVFSSSAPTLQSANIQLPSATFAFGTGGLNNNNYFFPASNTTARTGAIGTTSIPTAFFATLANWQAAVTPQDANSIQADPQYVSATDLHISLVSPNVNAGATGTGVVNDIDFQVRDAMPDIGADEPNGATAPANDIAAISIVTPAPGGVLINGTSTTPQARFYNAGSATQTGVMVRFTITGPGGFNYSNTQSIASIGSDEFVTVTFATAPVFTTAGSYMMTAQVITPDTNTSNDMVSGSFTVINPLSGTVTVGTGGQFTSLTNPGGLFDALNMAGASSNVTADIITDLTGETGAIRLNQLPGGFGLTIKPFGAPRTISGTAPANIGMIILNGADNVTIDGSLSGGTDRSLTITNNQTGLSTVIWIVSAGAANGANGNTVKNCIINGATISPAATTAGILGGSGVTLGNAAEAPNNNNTVTNNHIYRVQNSIYNQGNVGLDQNWTVTNNTFGSTVVADKNSFRGMLMGNAQNFVISGNVVNGVSSSPTTGAAMTGIQLAFNVNTGSVVNNRISDIRNNSATGTGAFGMQLSAAPALNVTIANNFISDAAALGSVTIVNNGHGINVNGAASAGAYKIYHNSINMNTNQASGTTSAFNVTTAVVAAGAIDLRNNILANTQTAGATRRSVHSAAAAAVFGTINFNDYFSTGSVGFIGGLDRPTLADWQTGTGQDANSKAVDPLFVSSTDLHIQPASPMINMGVAGTGITTDIDGQTRDATPDIGADEVILGPNPGTLQFSAPTYSVGEAGPTATITVTRTVGSAGTVTVQYATVAGGTATGGASCAAGIDYVNTSGTLTFVDGDISETFTVTICQDAVVEGNETINLALSNPTGGAVLGAQATAVLTITDDDVSPGSFSINDVRVFEGNSGATNAVFTVTYTGSAPASVQYATANGTATAGVDYLMTSGTLNFPAALSPEGSVQTRTVTVVVVGDTNKEANETFFVNLSSPSGATISDGQGVGIIIDEDRSYVADFDRDRVSDFSVFRASEERWYVLESASATVRIATFGTAGDIAVPGDYDADGLADLAVWRPSTGVWFRVLSSTSSTEITAWGTTGDKPVQGDYDGDGKTDLAVYRPSTGTWWVVRSSNGTAFAFQFGISTDRPVQGDYDGDAKTDIAVYRDGTWFIARSSDGAVQIASFGLAADRPVSGDFDGDGKFDLAIYRSGVWWILRSLTGTALAVPWGSASDIPVPADYDADGTTDLAVFRPSTGDWYVIRSSNSTSFGIHWGQNGDVPIPAAYLPQ